MKKLAILFVCSFLLLGCVSSMIAQVNDASRVVDQAWRHDIDRESDEYSSSFFNDDPDRVFLTVGAAFGSFGATIARELPEKRLVVASVESPLQVLSVEQWAEVREVENPRLKKLVGSTLAIRKKPTEGIMSVSASVGHHDGGSMVTLEYFIESPHYEDMGIFIPSAPPPHAAKLVSAMIFERVQEMLEDQGAR